ncbi:hypothetical protein M434DRAFT_27408 [Hypoxylon sp. CO27-5]|nr:hypothetical protein M434DRAFT_27408 [Hypoxylon sp. CO27-5]
MKFAYSLVTALLVAITGAYTPPEDLEDGIYIVGSSSGGSAKFRRDYETPTRVGDLIQPKDARSVYETPTRIGDLIQLKDARSVYSNTTESQEERRDEDTFVKHERGHSCEGWNTMMLADYTTAMNSFKQRCASQKVPKRKKNLAFCNGKQGILFAKAGSAIVYHCNVSCREQTCAAGHVEPFEKWADSYCGHLKGAWLYSSWDFTMGRSTWGSSFCGQVI